MNEPAGKELIERYKSNYGISSEAPISEEMILRHWELEKRLTQKLINSHSENRHKVFEECYSRLYSELKWLNEYATEKISYLEREKDYRVWLALIGSNDKPKKIYEVGSGKAELITYLARNGYSCTATEITQERGEKYSKNKVNWRNSDGVHLGNYEQHNSYDVVISDQVIEHIHPDDTQGHFRGAYEIIKPKGKYIFRVPHKYTGPHDISKIFKCETTMGMHLREMTFYEIRKIVRRAGFSKVGIVLTGSRRSIIKIFSRDGKVSTSIFYALVIIMECFAASIPKLRYRKKVIKLISRFRIFPDIFIVASK